MRPRRLAGIEAASQWKDRRRAECNAPGTSVAKVAMAHGINANVVHRWRQLAREGQFAVPAASGEFAPVSLPAVSASMSTRHPDPASPRRDIYDNQLAGIGGGRLRRWMRELLR
jgi:transposase